MPLSATKSDCGPIQEDPLKIHGVPHQEQVPLASEVLEQLKRVSLRWLNHLPAPGFASGRTPVYTLLEHEIGQRLQGLLGPDQTESGDGRILGALF